MKPLDELWKEFDKKKGKLSPEGIEDLKWHIDNNTPPYDAISTAIDMIQESSSPGALMHMLILLL